MTDVLQINPVVHAAAVFVWGKVTTSALAGLCDAVRLHKPDADHLPVCQLFELDGVTYI